MAVQYDATKIQRLADSLYSSARTVQLICWLVGLSILAASWYVPGYFRVPKLQAAIPNVAPAIPKMALPPEVAWLIVGVVLFIAVVLIGSAVGECIRGRAQSLLCMQQIERNTAAKTATPVA